MQATNTRPRFEVTARAHGLYSNAGVVLLAELADRLGPTGELGRRANLSVASLREQAGLFGRLCLTPTAIQARNGIKTASWTRSARRSCNSTRRPVARSRWSGADCPPIRPARWIHRPREATQMFHRNVGALDRALRLAAGIVGLVLAGIGVWVLATGPAGFCLLYLPLRISTAQQRQAVAAR